MAPRAEFSYLRAGSAASRMRPVDLPLAVIRAAKVLHLSGISQAISASACDACFAAMEAARAAGVRISYDTNLRLKLWPLPRARAIIRASLALADWALPSLDDARLLFECDDTDAILDACHAAGAPLVVLRCGPTDASCPTAAAASDRRSTPSRDRCDRRRRLLRRRVRRADRRGRRSGCGGALCQRRRAVATTGYGAVAPLPRHADVIALLEEKVAT
jgi:2-dehydro-3-deoxygluconokinase